IKQLRLELEQLRDRQTALQHTPQPNQADSGNDEDEAADSTDPKDGAAGGRIRRLRLVRLTLALVGAIFLCVAGMHLWHYMQSYQWTDDAEIEGHLDSISTRID